MAKMIVILATILYSGKHYLPSSEPIDGSFLPEDIQSQFEKAGVLKKVVEPQEESTIAKDDPELLRMSALEGVGKKTAIRIREVFATVEEIAVSDIEKIAEIQSVGADRAKIILNSARLAVGLDEDGNVTE